MNYNYIEEEFYNWVDDLFEEGYDLSNYTWGGLFEQYLSLIDEGVGREEQIAGKQIATGKGSPILPTTTTIAGVGKGPSAIPPQPKSPASPSPVLASQNGVTGVRSSNGEFRVRNFTPAETRRYISVGSANYNAQRAARDFTTAKNTGMSVWAAANPRLAQATAMQRYKYDRDIINKKLYRPGTFANPNESYDFAKPNLVDRDIEHLYHSIYEGKDRDDNLADNYPPFDKITRGDIVARIKGEDGGSNSRLKELMSQGMTRKDALAQIEKENKKDKVDESYDLDQISILYLMQEGYAKDLRSAQEIYENSSVEFKRNLHEIAPALLAIGARVLPLAARAIPAAGRFLASPAGQSTLKVGGRILRSPMARKVGQAGLNWAMNKFSGSGNEDSENTQNASQQSSEDEQDTQNQSLGKKVKNFIGSLSRQTMATASYEYDDLNPIEEEFYNWVDSLFKEGYDLSSYTWKGLFEVYLENI